MRWFKKPKIKCSFFFAYEAAGVCLGLASVDVCVELCPTINWNFVLLSCSLENKGYGEGSENYWDPSPSQDGSSLEVRTKCFRDHLFFVVVSSWGVP